MPDKNRTAEAALGQVDDTATLEVGPYTLGYLSIRRSESRRLAGAQGGSDEESQLLYEIAKRRYVGEDEFPDIETFEDNIGQDDLMAMVAWISGGDPEAVRLRARHGQETTKNEATGKKSKS